VLELGCGSRKTTSNGTEQLQVLNSFRYYIAQAIRGFLPFYVANRFSVSMPKVKSFVNAVRCHEAARLPLGSAGFCWGGKHVIKLAHGENADNGKPLVDAVYTGHPSQLSIPDEIERVRKPVSIAVGDKDAVLVQSQVEQIKRILQDKRTESEVRVYPGAGHGFCVRADPLNDDVTQQSLEAEQQAIKWFLQHFKSPK
jgi:dienelactone hydrolase